MCRRNIPIGEMTDREFGAALDHEMDRRLDEYLENQSVVVDWEKLKEEEDDEPIETEEDKSNRKKMFDNFFESSPEHTFDMLDRIRVW